MCTNTATVKRFSLKKGKVLLLLKKNSLILGHAISVHKSLGSTLTYMQGNLNQSTGKKTAMGKNYQQPISEAQGQFYNLLSRDKSLDTDKVLF